VPLVTALNVRISELSKVRQQNGDAICEAVRHSTISSILDSFMLAVTRVDHACLFNAFDITHACSMLSGMYSWWLRQICFVPPLVITSSARPLDPRCLWHSSLRYRPRRRSQPGHRQRLCTHELLYHATYTHASNCATTYSV